MVTENLLQNILGRGYEREATRKEKEKEIYRPHSGAVGGGEKEKETIVRTAE